MPIEVMREVIMRAGRWLMLCAFVIAGGALAPRASAQQPAPPYQVSGFTYTSLPNNVHMFTCVNASCGPGARVSYILSGPRPDYTFATYQQERQQLATAFKQRYGDTIAFKFLPPIEKGDHVFRIFEQVRETPQQDGSTLHTISRTISSSRGHIEVISSTIDRVKALANLEQFTIGAMLVVSPAVAAPTPGTPKQAPQSRTEDPGSASTPAVRRP